MRKAKLLWESKYRNHWKTGLFLVRCLNGPVFEWSVYNIYLLTLISGLGVWGSCEVFYTYRMQLNRNNKTVRYVGQVFIFRPVFES